MNSKTTSSEIPGPKKLFRIIYKFFLISLGAHLIGLLFFGGVVILRKLQPVEEVKFQAPPPSIRVEPRKRQYKLRAHQQQQQSSRPQLESRLQSTRMSSFALPEIKARVAPVKKKVSRIPGTSTSLGDGFGIEGMGMGMGIGTIFGVTIEAKNLGVILDYSASTHHLIDQAIEEIQKAFPDAMLVLAPACSIIPETNKWGVYPVNEFNRKKEELGPAAKDIKTMHLLFGGEHADGKKFRGLLEKNESFLKLYEEGGESGLMHVLYIDPETHMNGPHYYGIQMAFEWLIDQEVDGIYWFADFADRQDPELTSELIRKLKRKKIKVYQHILKGSREPKEIRLEIAEKTGGQVIRE